MGTICLIYTTSPVMDVVLFIGIQGSGTSSFYHHRFFHTHLRINLDMLKTRHRERRLVETCLAIGQPFVVDNTNPTIADRQRYIEPAKQAQAEVSGYYFQSRVREAMARNAGRPTRVPDAAIRGTHARLQLPSYDEGFDRLSYVRIDPTSGFVVEAWSDEV